MKMHLQKPLLYLFLAFSSLSYFSISAFAQGLPRGLWAGDLDLGGAAPYKLIIDFKPSAATNTKVLMSMPANGLHDLRAEHTAFTKDSLRLRFRDHGMAYAITVSYTGAEMRGYFAAVNAGFRAPITLTPADINSLRPARPQTPKAPFAYNVMPTEFAGGDAGVMLQGTITAPKGKKAVPGVVLVSGSGPHNRDGEQFYHKSFLVLADELTKRGFAVLRYDERGVGESSGNFGGNFTEDFARDAAAAVKALREDKRLKVKGIYVIGHSEGTLMTEIVAAEDPTIAGIVLMAGVGLSGVELSKMRHRATLKSRGMSEAEIESSQDIIAQDKAYEIIAAAPDSATARINYNEWFRKETGADVSYSSMYIEPYLNPWHFHHLHFNPKPYLLKIKAPVLAISGSKDSQSPAAPNLAAIKAALNEGGNNNFTQVVVPKLNHFMQTSVTGAYDEPYILEETFSADALKIIGDWLEQQTGIFKEAKSGKASKSK